jgi:signal transduction histidine kinase
MLLFIWGVTFVSSGMLIALFLLLLRPFLEAPKNLQTYLFFLGLLFEVFGLTGATVSIARLPISLMLAGQVPTYFSLVPGVFPALFFLGFSCNLLYVISIQKKISKTDQFFVVVPIFSLSILLILIKTNHFGFLGFQADAERSLIGGLITLGNLYMCFCFDFYLNRAQKNLASSNSLLTMISKIVKVSIFFWLLYILFLLFDFLSTFALSKPSWPSEYIDLVTRGYRLIFCILVEIMIGLHWLQVYSVTAIQERVGRQKIDQLMLEKDELIQSLINKQALAETGALAAGLTHELNQYLARIQLNNEELLIKSGQHSAQELLEPSLNRINQATRSASKLILSIKKLFKKEDEELKQVQPDRLIEDVISVFKSRLDQSEIQVVYFLNCKEKVELWDTLFRQVISNLFLNAIEALETRQQSIKRITVSTEVVDSNFICCISDNGPGVPKSITDEVFPLFKTTKSSGTGVGLWLSKYIVERHKGALQILQSAEGGALLRVAIPLRDPTFEGLLR